MMEAQIAIALIAQRYRLVLAGPRTAEPELAITMRAGSVWARLERR